MEHADHCGGDRPTLSRGSIAGWMHGGYTCWGDSSQLVAPEPNDGDLRLCEIYDCTATELEAAEVPECLPGGQPVVLAPPRRAAALRVALETELSVGAALRPDRNAHAQADFDAAGVRPWLYDSPMSGRVSLRLEPVDVALLSCHRLKWDLGGRDSAWHCVRRYVAVHQGTCAGLRDECAVLLPVLGGVLCFPSSPQFFHVQGPLNGDLACYEFLVLVFLASWADLSDDELGCPLPAILSS